MAKITANGHIEIARWRNDYGQEFVLTRDNAKRRGGFRCRVLYKIGPGEGFKAVTAFVEDVSFAELIAYVERRYVLIDQPERGYRRV